ncbi:MAG: NAD-dependent epimerase/dehydratase family protein [Rubrivivax sp.]|nr:NAD-dependent epimerase/dehydratase family protein [Rubrivivax sp.]
MTRPRTVLVLGATGRFGQAAVQAFAAAGWRVLAQARRKPAALPAGAVHVDSPLEDTAALQAAAAAASAVVYATSPPYTEWARQMLPLARHGMALAERLGALFMLPGNVYAYGQHMPPTLREDTPERPSTEKGRLRADLEAELRTRSDRGALRAVVIRAGDFYGGGSGSWLDIAIVKSLAKGKLVYPGPLDVPHAWAYLPDLARAFVAVAERAERAERAEAAGADGTAGAGKANGVPAFETLHFAGHTLTGRELLAGVEAAADELGWHPARGWRHGGMPWGLLRAAGVVVPMLREVARMSYLWRVPHALDGATLEQAAGPLRNTPPHQALRAALVDLGFGPRAAAAGGQIHVH